jgi:phage major head subunit gpT-like protein
VRLDRLNSGAPFLNSHDSWSLDSILGVVADGSARIQGTEGHATVRFSDRADVEPIWRDVVNGIIRNISVGYRVHKYEIEKRDGQRPLYRAVDWEPLELSAVAIGADPGAHFRSMDASTPCVVIRADKTAAHAAFAKEAAMPREEVAVAVPAARTEAVETVAVNADVIRAEERSRVADISTLCRKFAIPAATEADFISKGVTVEAVREAVLDELATRDAEVSVRVPAEVKGARQDETETRRLGMEESLVASFTRAAPSERAKPYAGFSLVDLAAERLGERRVPGGFGAREDILRRAFHSSTDFPLLFENSLNKALANCYKAAEPTYRKIARQRSYVDFRDHSTIRIGDFPTLQAVDQEAGEIKAGTFGEAREKTRVIPYGVRVNLSRTMLVNDTLDGITQVLNDRGMAVAQFEDTTFYAMLNSGAANNGPTLTETARQVFNATDGTLAGAAAAISVASLSLGRAALRKRTSKDGRKLDIPGAVLLVGPDKETEAQQVVAPLQAQQAGNVNPFSGLLEVVCSAQLSGNVWYVFADPLAMPDFEWGLLQGYDAPRFRMEDVFGTQGTSLTLEHDYGCGAIDFRGGYRNAGA